MKLAMSTKKTETQTETQFDWLLIGLVVVALLFRVLFLALKPPHFDEGINGWWVDQMIARGYYPYDPTNYHGPLHFYILFVFKLLFGRNLWALRIPSALFGVAAVYMVAQLKEYVGKFTAYAAALFVAVSPGMVFYSRYAIHESELLFFSLLTLLGFLRFQTYKDSKALWMTALGLAGMIVTKETFFIHLVCFGIAYLCLLSFETIMGIPRPAVEKRHFSSVDLATAIAVSVLTIFLFYSGFLVFPAGILDFFRSFAAWVKTGEVGPHQKSFWYWTELFMRYEWVSFVGLVLTIKLILPSSRWLRLIGIYGFGIFLTYSLIPYKTPWCIMQLIWPVALVSASILEDLSRHGSRPRRWALGAVALLMLCGAAESVRLNFFHYTDDQEPYVYVQTFNDVMPIIEKINELVRSDRNNLHMPMKLYLDSNWPLPWLLGDFTQVSYFGPSVVGNIDSDVVMIDRVNQEKAEHLFTQSYFRTVFRLRSAQGESVVYFKLDKFRALFGANAEIFSPFMPLVPK